AVRRAASPPFPVWRLSMNVKLMSDMNLKGRKLLIREDLNVPVKDGKVTSDARIRAALPSIRMALEGGAKVIVMSHLGRPTEGEFEEKYSLQPVADHLGGLLGMDIPVVSDWKNGIDVDSDLILLENVRFNLGEMSDDEGLVKAYVKLCDIFVMDDFGTAHRAQASTHGVARFAAEAGAGPLLADEMIALEKELTNPERPMVALVGGAKVSSKLMLL